MKIALECSRTKTSERSLCTGNMAWAVPELIIQWLNKGGDRRTLRRKLLTQMDSKNTRTDGRTRLERLGMEPAELYVSLGPGFLQRLNLMSGASVDSSGSARSLGVYMTALLTKALAKRMQHVGATLLHATCCMRLATMLHNVAFAWPTCCNMIKQCCTVTTQHVASVKADRQTDRQTNMQMDGHMPFRAAQSKHKTITHKQE